MKILYVEDNDDNIYMLQRRLVRAGFTVVIARDGAEGVTMAASEQPALILMDMGLPVLDGWEATRRVKAAAETKHIPVIALTANAMTGICFVEASALICRVASQPSSTGRPMSMRIRAGCSAAAIATPSAPSLAMTTVKPARTSRRCSM